ncbi:hypothetical protein AB0F81_50720, partial [Actinoplanes sp. NPDC024001]
PSAAAAFNDPVTPTTANDSARSEATNRRSSISQPVEVSAVRRLLIKPDSGLVAQMVLRVGYGRAAEGSPRRLVSEVLLRADCRRP